MSLSQELAALMALRDAGELSPAEYAAAKSALFAMTTRGTGELGQGSRVGNYLVMERVGEGGMGVVYRARHQDERFAITQGGDVAIKLIHGQYANHAGHVERFFREAQLGMRLSHPNLLPVYETVNEGGRVGMVMAWAQGRPLATMIGHETGPIPWERAKPMVWQLLDAVAYAHEHGVVHRDLKPENVMVDREGGVKVLDFGIAKASWERRTKTGMGLGTVDYMAPEQYAGAGDVDARADVYALGMTLYEMLAGRLPWGKETPEFDVLTQKRQMAFPPPTHFYPNIPSSVVAVIMQSLRVDADDRFVSIDSMRKALAAEPVVARAKPSVPTEVVRFVELLCGDKTGYSPDVLQAMAGGLWGPICPPGVFMMGSPHGEVGRDRGEELHQVRLTRGFQVAMFPVTQALWSAVMGGNPSSHIGATLPVEQVSWHDCMDFCSALNRRLVGLRAVELPDSQRFSSPYRLLTEAEWEYAARAGVATAFSGGAEPEAVAWMMQNSGGRSHPVGRLRPNAWGLHDMSGNVWEWTLDRKADYSKTALQDPTGPGQGSYRVARGGSWANAPALVRVASRQGNIPTSSSSLLGFRLARTVVYG